MQKHNLFYCTLLCVLLYSAHIAGQSIVYTYDAAGNRTGRQYIVQMQHSRAQIDSTQTESEAIAPFGERTITVHPNPVQELLTITIGGTPLAQPAALLLYDAKGTLLQQTAGTSFTTVNMSHYSSGWYVLRVSSEDKTVEFKIIKQ